MEHRDRAIVLKKSKFGESDLIVTLFLEKGGKRNAIAKGALRSRKRFGPLLDVGTLATVRFQERPRSDLLFLLGAEEGDVFSAVRSQTNWRKSWNTIVAGEYALELAFHFLPEQKEEGEKFGLLLDFLANLEQNSLCNELLRFEYEWLVLAGWGPQEGDLKMDQPFFDQQWRQLLGKNLRSRKMLEEIFR
ncbi:MAG: DNA repair protein RecO [Deltaproteobacteria bacterium]|nr:DNA repair protein RecO [Deltaproteobacteria bacterium]